MKNLETWSISAVRQIDFQVLKDLTKTKIINESTQFYTANFYQERRHLVRDHMVVVLVVFQTPEAPCLATTETL